MNAHELAAEAADARAFAARLEAASLRAEDEGDQAKAQRLHNNARLHRRDAREAEAKLAQLESA